MQSQQLPDFSEFGPNAAFILELYEAYRTAPELVGEPWVSFFREREGQNSRSTYGTSVKGQTGGEAPSSTSGFSIEYVRKQAGVSRLIDAYRSHGHYAARVNPLSRGVVTHPDHDELELSSYGLTEEDRERPFFTDGLMSEGTATLSEILSKLHDSYCGSMGFEYMHLPNREEREFLRERIETRPSGALSDSEKRDILKRLIEAETFENSLHKRYVGQKRFSLEGAETLIPMLSAALDTSAALGAAKVILGMPHRGRLNVLLHIAGKPLERIFCEFEDRTTASVHGNGDVKYHLGWSSEFDTVHGRRIHVELCPNPSHLEFVNPVVEGMCRAEQDKSFGGDRKRVIPFLLHGEAAFSGQGIVYETLNFTGTEGYDTGGTVHWIVNNQIGFTATSSEQRGTTYCSDLARGINAPVFHVNAEDPEGCVWASRLAVEYRQRFGRDVLIDLFCHRKYGHNEGDDPTFTQPLMYHEIKEKALLSQQYVRTLAEPLSSEYDTVRQEFVARFEEASERARTFVYGDPSRPRNATTPTLPTEKELAAISASLTKTPEGFATHPKLLKLLEKRASHVTSGEGIEWGVAEGLAFGTLLQAGVDIRLSGQDSARGTFSHRHSELHDTATGASTLPLNSLSGRGRYEVFNSVLSEAGVLGFEYGYAHQSPGTFVLWEAQFGDFANGAQVIIDQFIASGEAKWGYLSGVTLLLPHGYEGQGPEHSSARLERFLQLCAEENVTVAYPSTSAQYFHLIRLQGLSDTKRPLIVMTPKSLLRLPDASPPISEFTTKGWQELIVDDVGSVKKSSATVLLTGKVYYDVVSALRSHGRSARVLRIEQLYPTPGAAIRNAITEGELLWIQEEPRNMGAWSFISESLGEVLPRKLHYGGRLPSASPAAGSGKYHTIELNAFIEELLHRCK